MTRIVALFALVFASLISTPALAEKDFSYNQSGLTLSRSTGRTLVGITRDSSKTWSVYLDRNKKAKFHFSSGKRATATWRRPSRNTICFKGLVENDRNKEICKYAPSNGRGMDWKTVTIKEGSSGVTYTPVVDEHRGSSQIVYSHAGDTRVNQSSYRRNLNDWRGKVIVGRTLKDKEAWFVKLDRNGIATFIYGSGKKRVGRYTLSGTTVCFTWPNNPDANGCRKPALRDGKMRWISTKDGGSISEVVYLNTIDTARAPVKKAPVKKAPTPAKDELLAMKQITALPMATKASHRETNTLIVSTRSNRTRVFDTFSASRKDHLYTLDEYYRVIAFTHRGDKWVGYSSDGIDLYETATGKLLQSVSDAPALKAYSTAKAVGFDRFDTAFLVGHSDGRIVRRDAGTLAIKADRKPTIEGRSITALSVNTANIALVGYKSGRMESYHALSMVSYDKPPAMEKSVLDIDWTKDGKTAFVLDAGGSIKRHTFEGSKITATSRKKVFSSEIFDAALSKSDSEYAVLGKGKLVRFGARSLTQRASYTDNPDLGRATGILYSPSDKGIIVGSHIGATKMYAVSAKHSDALREAWTKLAPTARGRIDFAAAAQQKIQTEKATAFRDYAGLRARTDTLFFDGKCAEYSAAADALRPEHRRENCADVSQKLAISKVLLGNDCDAIEAAAAGRPEAADLVATCRKPAEYFKKIRKAEAARSAYASALATGDCATVETGMIRFGSADDLPDCQLNEARATKNARKLYFAAVKFEGAKDYIRARSAYEYLMEDHIEDDLALKAAERLTELNDLALKQEAENAKIAALEQAKKEAEDAALEVERQAALAALEATRRAEAERKRRAEEDRKRREAERKAREADERKRKRAEEVRAAKQKRIDKIKSALSKVNVQYGFQSGYTTVSSNVGGTARYYDISGEMKITPRASFPVTARDFCDVTIQSGVYPRYNKINLPNNKYFNPNRAYNRFSIRLTDKGRDDGLLYFNRRNGLFKLAGDKLDVRTTTNANWIEFNWATSITKHEQSGAFSTSNSRRTFIQLPGNRSPDKFLDDFRDLIGACQAARADL